MLKAAHFLLFKTDFNQHRLNSALELVSKSSFDLLIEVSLSCEAFFKLIAEILLRFPWRNMGSSSRELLHLERKNFTPASALESALLVCKKNSEANSSKPLPDGKPLTTNVAKSQVLGKVKDFLGVISQANKKLQLECEENAKKYDIEELTGTESEVIEMDLMLGIADLHTPEAVAAAESAVTNGKHLVPADSDSSDSESEDSSDDEADNDSDDDHKTSEHKAPISVKDGTGQAVGRNGSKKRQKIIEML